MTRLLRWLLPLVLVTGALAQVTNCSANETVIGQRSLSVTTNFTQQQSGTSLLLWVPASFHGTGITMHTPVSVATSLLVCEAPPGLLMPSVKSTGKSVTSLKSKPLVLPACSYELVYCVEAGMSTMQPFTAASDFYIPLGASNPGADTTTLTTSMSWTGNVYSASSVFCGT